MSVGGIWGAVQGKGADYSPTEIDPKTQKLIDQGVTRSTAPTGDIAGQLNNGVVDSGRSMLQGDQSLSQEAARTGQNPSMLTAIRNQYGKVADSNIRDIVRNNQFQSNIVKSNWLNQSAQQALAQQRVATQNYEGLANAYASAQNARGQVLASALSFGGSAAGAGMSKQNKGYGKWENYGTTAPDVQASNSEYGTLA